MSEIGFGIALLLFDAYPVCLIRWSGAGASIPSRKAPILRTRRCGPGADRRPIALNRKNALFAGSDGGAEHWAVIASLIETCKLNNVDPHAFLASTITEIVNGHPNGHLDEILPWLYSAATALKNVA
jgi:IS66 C-terminal element